jgi:hypothetical protein
VVVAESGEQGGEEIGEWWWVARGCQSVQLSPKVCADTRCPCALTLHELYTCALTVRPCVLSEPHIPSLCVPCATLTVDCTELPRRTEARRVVRVCVREEEEPDSVCPLPSVHSDGSAFNHNATCSSHFVAQDTNVRARQFFSMVSIQQCRLRTHLVTSQAITRSEPRTTRGLTSNAVTGQPFLDAATSIGDGHSQHPQTTCISRSVDHLPQSRSLHGSVCFNSAFLASMTTAAHSID